MRGSPGMTRRAMSMVDSAPQRENRFRREGRRCRHSGGRRPIEENKARDGRGSRSERDGPPHAKDGKGDRSALFIPALDAEASPGQRSSPSIATADPDNFSVELLRSLRNDVTVQSVIAALSLPTAGRGVRLTLRCSGCSRFPTAAHAETNLVRCFRCGKSFNTIDLVVRERSCSFRQAVNFVAELLDSRADHCRSPRAWPAERSRDNEPGPTGSCEDPAPSPNQTRDVHHPGEIGES